MAHDRPGNRPRYVCTALNAAGRPVPMFDPFADWTEIEEPLWPQGPVEHTLFGPRDKKEAAAMVASRPRAPVVNAPTPDRR